MKKYKSHIWKFVGFDFVQHNNSHIIDSYKFYDYPLVCDIWNDINKEQNLHKIFKILKGT